ncbi:fungal-specific transcription factor domain-containing protein [Ilyonectria destructans]|nr:fungal-specific transcription factor domain-containing protein [Ilyonectria destructans]
MISPRTQTRPSRRSLLACEHCREKKLKCDGAKPACEACRARGRRCIPQTPSHQPRPTNRRIRELEGENARLWELLKEKPSRADPLPNSEPSVAYTSLASREQVHAVETPPVLRHLDAEQRCFSSGTCAPPGSSAHIRTGIATSPAAESPQDNASSYHGPTSVLFDEISQTPVSRERGGRFSVNAEHVRCGLVAESAKQRQLEVVHLASNQLDFDGVDPELGMDLLSIFWARQLHVGLIVYRTAFMRDMASGGPYFSKLLLNAIYYSASKHSSAVSIRQDAADRATAGWAFRQRFTDLLRDVFGSARITTLQALLIMTSSLFTRCDERSISWLYAGNAFNMIIDCGIHVESWSSGNMAAEESEIRRRVYWGAFLVDKLQCLYQGRHPCLRISDANVPLWFVDSYEELEVSGKNSFCNTALSKASPSYHLSTLEYYCKLSIIMERIHSKVYAVSHLTRTLDNLREQCLDLQNELERWRENLPPHLDFISSNSGGNPLPYNLGMLAVYNVLVILVHRLLLSGTELTLPTSASDALITCWKAASEITHILQVHERLYRPLSGTFSLCYAAYIAATIHTHILAQQGDSFSSLVSLRVCLSNLDKYQAIYSAAKRAKLIIERLLDGLGIRPYDDEPAGGDQRRPGPSTCAATVELDSEASSVPAVDGLGPSSNNSAYTPPGLHTDLLDSLDFDALFTAEGVQSFQETTESWFPASGSSLLYNLASHQEDVVVEPTSITSALQDLGM